MFFVRLSFFIGYVLSSVIRDTQRRRRFRGTFNLICLRPFIARFMKREYGIKIKTLKYVRQQSLNRVVGIVNDKYYVKIFRKIPVKRVQNFAKLMSVIEKTVSVKINHVVADNKLAMYSYKKIDGMDIHRFEKEFVIKHKTKLFNQIKKIIQEIQSIDVQSVPSEERFVYDMHFEKHGNPSDIKKCVFGHFDMNFGSFLFDKNLNIVALLDWDTIAITDELDGDWNKFMRYWGAYIK